MRFAHTHRMVFVLIVAIALLAAGCGAATSTAPADTGPAVPASADAATDKAAPSLAEVVREVKSGVIRVEVESCDDAFEGTGVLSWPSPDRHSRACH